MLAEVKGSLKNIVGTEEPALQQEDSLLSNRQQPWLECLGSGETWGRRSLKNSQSQQGPSVCPSTLSVHVSIHISFLIMTKTPTSRPKAGRACLDSRFEGTLSITMGKARQAELKVASHIVVIGSKGSGAQL